MGLDEDAVDLFEVHNAGLVADGFDEGSQAKIAGASQEAFAGIGRHGGQSRLLEKIATPSNILRTCEKGSVNGIVMSCEFAVLLEIHSGEPASKPILQYH
jgi:hypothetical protein